MGKNDSRAPETLAQAAAWDQVKSNAVRFGLCRRCAAQLAWAHQEGSGGWEAARPPCPGCQATVALLPVAKTGGWRTVRGSASNPQSWPIPIVTGSGGVLVGGKPADRFRQEQNNDSEVFRV